ncbi:MAG: NAD(P)H-dependent glycerol-3-phosphate dehydrogenase [Actinomycetota bacterium]
MKISVIGAGSWGTAIAVLLANKGFDVGLWAREENVANGINQTHHNPLYLKDIEIPSNAHATTDPAQALQNAHAVVLVPPSHAMRSVLKIIKDFLQPGMLLISLTKGIEVETLKRMTEVILDELPSTFGDRLAVLSGPNHSEEVSRNIPSATVISSLNQDVAEELQNVFMTPYFRVYTNPDLVGVELSGATKNIIAIAAGMSDGLGFGDNTKASLMTRGLAEITRLGVALGANPLTFSGLAGVGDLTVTCFSRHSRNRRVGEEIAKGRSLEEVTREMVMIAEGIHTTKAVYELAKKHQLIMPITEKVYEVLYEGKDPRDCVSELMTRSATSELTEIP